MTGMALPAPTLRTARLRLRPFGDTDADDLFTLHSSAYVLRYWDAPPWSEPGRAGRFITACRQMEQEGTGARLAVDRVSDGAFIGWCSLGRWNPDYRSASLGYCYTDAAWGHGYATEAARALSIFTGPTILAGTGECRKAGGGGIVVTETRPGSGILARGGEGQPWGSGSSTGTCGTA